MYKVHIVRVYKVSRYTMYPYAPSCVRVHAPNNYCLQSNRICAPQHTSYLDTQCSTADNCAGFNRPEPRPLKDCSERLLRGKHLESSIRAGASVDARFSRRRCTILTPV